MALSKELIRRILGDSFANVLKQYWIERVVEEEEYSPQRVSKSGTFYSMTSKFKEFALNFIRNYLGLKNIDLSNVENMAFCHNKFRTKCCIGHELSSSAKIKSILERRSELSTEAHLEETLENSFQQIEAGSQATNEAGLYSRPGNDKNTADSDSPEPRASSPTN